MNRSEAPDILKLTSEIVVAFLAQRAVDPEHISTLIKDVRIALSCDLDLTEVHAPASSVAAFRAAPRAPLVNLSAVAEAGRTKPEVLVSESAAEAPPLRAGETLFDEYLICLEDGKRYRSLRRHLMAKYGMTPDDYRAKWDLPDDYPMVAPSYARERSEVAKRTGLGRSPAPVRPRTKDARRPRA
jgi:predicted transcriptional regulator